MFWNLNNVFEPSWLVLAAGVIFLSQVVYSMAGFGGGMVAVALAGACGLDLKFFVPFFLLFCLITETAIFIKDRKNINASILFPLLIWATPAMVIGAFFLKAVSGTILLLILGVMICLLSLYYLFFEKHRPEFHIKRGLLKAIFGILSGLLGGAYGVGGPPVIIYLKTISTLKVEFRATLISFFLVMGLIRFVIYAQLGFYDASVVINGAIVFPFAILGTFVGMKLHNLASENLFRTVTSGFLLCCGILLIFQNISTLIS